MESSDKPKPETPAQPKENESAWDRAQAALAGADHGAPDSGAAGEASIEKVSGILADCIDGALRDFAAHALANQPDLQVRLGSLRSHERVLLDECERRVVDLRNIPTGVLLAVTAGIILVPRALTLVVEKRKAAKRTAPPAATPAPAPAPTRARKAPK